MKKLFKKFRHYRLGQEGFTLVELMVVVAIIALLAATALPQFRKYQAKSRVSEAKLALASIYTAEESYIGEFSNYASCLAYMGYVPTGDSADRYFTVGFSAHETSHFGVMGGCTGTYVTASYLGIKMGIAIGTNLVGNIVAADNLSYTASAVGLVDKDFAVAHTLTASVWTINEDKQLTEINEGY